ncbi:MAG: hypothetical protein JRJ70_08115, partial [Deltaproteobacteria bacterium]|nr:hypothetical protein [Deltaproteobacteria bacterium]
MVDEEEHAHLTSPLFCARVAAMTTREKLQETLCDRLFWNTAERDDAKVADYLYHRREMDVVYAMDEATLFDSFFTYLQEIEVFPLLDHLDPR